MRQMGDRLEYLLPCGHVSVSLVCFRCAMEAFTPDDGPADAPEPPGPAGPSLPSGRLRQTAAGERFEYLLPCGHKSAGLVCFRCASDEFVADERDEGAGDRPKPRIPMAVQRELTVTVLYPPHVRRFAARRRKR